MIRSKEEVIKSKEKEIDNEEVGEDILIVWTAVTEEEAAERLEVALEMEVNEEVEGEGEKWGDGTQRSLGDL